MAAGWLVVLQNVPWTEVIRNAPKVAGAAKKLWNAVTKKSSAPDVTGPAAKAQASSEIADVPSMQEHIVALEAGMADLNSQMLASSELIKELADQNTQLVRRIETHRVRMIWLIAMNAVTAVVAMLSLILVLR